MAKKKDTSMGDWSKAITENWDRQREIDNTLSPSKGQIRYIKDYARVILEKATYIDMTSALAHENIISFEQAQQIINVQKERLKSDIEYLQQYLSDED